MTRSFSLEVSVGRNKRDVKWVRERDEVGGTEGAEGDQDQAGRRERADSGGTMTWKSRAGDHTLPRHIWGGRKYPDLFTHTLTLQMHTHARMHAHTHTHPSARKYTRKRNTLPQRETHCQRLHNKGKRAMSRTSKHNHHHSSAYTHRPLPSQWTVDCNTHKSRENLPGTFLLETCIRDIELLLQYRMFPQKKINSEGSCFQRTHWMIDEGNDDAHYMLQSPETLSIHLHPNTWEYIFKKKLFVPAVEV